MYESRSLQLQDDFIKHFLPEEQQTLAYPLAIGMGRGFPLFKIFYIDEHEGRNSQGNIAYSGNILCPCMHNRPCPDFLPALFAGKPDGREHRGLFY